MVKPILPIQLLIELSHSKSSESHNDGLLVMYIMYFVNMVRKSYKYDPNGYFKK